MAFRVLEVGMLRLSLFGLLGLLVEVGEVGAATLIFAVLGLLLLGFVMTIKRVRVNISIDRD